MTPTKPEPILRFLPVLLLCLSLSSSAPVAAQSGNDIEQLKGKVLELTRQTKYADALPLLEKIVVAEPKNAEMHFYLGFALIAQANVSNDIGQARALRIRARNAFLRAKELNVKEPVVDALIASIPLDGSRGQAFSQNIAADSLMTEAEAFFSQGKLAEALKNYEKALELDPKLYHAALFAGDVFVQKGDYVQAEAWYKRAIAIDPSRETAYRYSATPLMKQGKTDAARDLYVEAFITEPYNQFARAGLIQWATITKIALAHPTIEIPTNVSFDDKGNSNIKLDAGALSGSTDDGSFAWISYGLTRSAWRKDRFAKNFPKEAVYRHSLAEEVDALRSVIKMAISDKGVKTLNRSLAKLKKLDDEGLLEAYVLMARADEGISKDHPAYLKGNREKLRRYVLDYVVTGGGK
jgi:tetratricopeptide (TPR) repeat protein